MDKSSELLYNKRLGITEQDVKETDDIDLLSQWQADLNFQLHWLKTPWEGEEELKKKERTRIYVSRFYNLIRRRIHEVKKILRTEAGVPHVLRKDRKMSHKEADRFMQTAKRFLPEEIYAAILDETHKRRRAANEMNVRYNEKKGIK